jgi:hypothetical protein
MERSIISDKVKDSSPSTALRVGMTEKELFPLRAVFAKPFFERLFA